MEVYPIKSEGKNGNTKFPMYTGNTEEFIHQRYDFYLKDEFGHRYRLHAKNATLRMISFPMWYFALSAAER